MTEVLTRFGLEENKKGSGNFGNFIGAMAIAVATVLTPQESMAQQMQNKEQPVASVKNNHELSPEDKKLLEQTQALTMEFLNKNAPSFAKNKTVAIMTTMGALECISNGKDAPFFFRQLTKSLDENKITKATFENFKEFAPTFLQHISAGSFKGPYHNLAVLYREEQAKIRLADADARLAESEDRLAKWKTVEGLLKRLDSEI